MAKYRLHSKQEHGAETHHLIDVSFPDPRNKDETLRFTQRVMLPKRGIKQAAQAYADEYEENYGKEIN